MKFKSKCCQKALAVLYSGGLGFTLDTITLPTSAQRFAQQELSLLPTDQLLQKTEANIFLNEPASWSARLLIEAFSFPFSQ